jgi:hypothetical protein
MSYTLVPLLMHSEQVPPSARDALKAAYAVGPDERAEMLHSAARILRDETGLECRDVLELVGLTIDHREPDDGDCR